MKRGRVNRGRLYDLAALAAGGLLPLSLSPFNFWPLALVAPVALFVIARQGGVRRTVLRFYLFNLGMFAVGVSWIYVSIHTYGGASIPLAAGLVAAFVIAWSLTSIPFAWVYARFFRSSDGRQFLGFAGLWALQEGFRGWFLTGFPWLFLGYGVMGTPLENFAPWLGIFGVSLLALLAALSLLLALERRSLPWALPLTLVVALGLIAGRVPLTEPVGSLSVSLVQGNVDQHVKWRPENRLPILNLYRDASEDEWGRDLIVWPEASITLFREHAGEYLKQLDQMGKARGTSLVLGIPDRDRDDRFLNTVIALGKGQGRYVKRRLVPFGEYVPLEKYLRGLITFFDLPMSRNRPGPAAQPPLMLDGQTVSVAICYEVVYPELVRRAGPSPALLLTVSNDTWFGASIGPWQHLQMARMRALENGRSMVRATSNGITAVIDHRGRLVADLPGFAAGVLRQEVELRGGETPFHRFGTWPSLMAAALLLLVAQAPVLLRRVM